MRSSSQRLGSRAAFLALVVAGVPTCRGYDVCAESPDLCSADAAGPMLSGAAGRASAGSAAGGDAGDSRAASGRSSRDGGAPGATAGKGAATEGKAPDGGSAGKHPSSDGVGGEEAASAGAPFTGDGGEAGVAQVTCEVAFGDCDGSTLNGCETNLRASVRHCGACDRECAGLCVDGECQKFEVLVPNQFAPENIALAPDYAFLAARDAANMLHVLRVSRWTGQIDTLAAVAPWFRIRASAVGSMRVYLSDEDVLKSFALDGTDPRDENLTVETIAAHGGFLYYSSLGALYRWSETDRTSTLVREFGATQSIELAGCTAGVFAAVNYPAATDPERYELYFLTPTVEPTLFHAGTGVAGRLVAAYGDAYFLVREAERVELRHVPGDPDVLDADATSLVELAAVSGGVLATFLSATSEGLRFYAQSDTHIRFEWATRGDLLRFTSTFDGELWFVDSSQASLARSKRPEL